MLNGRRLTGIEDNYGRPASGRQKCPWSPGIQKAILP